MTAHQHQEASALDERLATLRPAPPNGLRDRCLAAPTPHASPAIDDAWMLAVARDRRHRAGRAAALSAAAVLVVGAVVWGPPGAAPRASAAALLAAIDALDTARHVHVISTFDDGVAAQRIELWLSAGFGSRIESDGIVEIHDERAGRRAVFDPRTGRFEVAAVRDPARLRALLDRASADRNVEVLRAMAARDEGFAVDEAVPPGTGAVRRLAGLDARGRPIQATIDVESNRVLRTEGWTLGTDAAPPVHVVTTFDYPPGGLDPGLFDTTPPVNAAVVEADAYAAARMQCMITLRDLAQLVVDFTDGHGRLPAGLDDLGPHAGRPIDDCLWCAVGEDLVPIRAYLNGHDGSAASPLFECVLPGGERLAAFADGHVETLSR